MSPFCERCGCEDEKYFVIFQGRDQCRRCISYQGDEGESITFEYDIDEVFKFKLTPQQKSVSEAIYLASLKGNVLVHAVCGAGKSELVVQSISNYLMAHKRVGIAIARRQVVLELAQRYQEIFPQLKVVPVCHGHTTDLSGQLIITTAHQLYRFHKQFDCLIIDEPDAFPYNSDEVLQGFAQQACKGVRIYLTATPDEKVRAITNQEVKLFRRPHQFDLPTPKVRKGSLMIQIVHLLNFLKKHDQPILIFVPSKRLGKQLSMLLQSPFVYADHPNLDYLIQQFKQQNINPLLCTTILERGVTFKNVQVVIVEAQHPVFTLSTLIQISGRVGRSIEYPTGEVLFLCSSISKTLKECIQVIQKANTV